MTKAELSAELNKRGLHNCLGLMNAINNMGLDSYGNIPENKAKQLWDILHSFNQNITDHEAACLRLLDVIGRGDEDSPWTT